MLYREPKLLKFDRPDHKNLPLLVSVLYREPKLLKVKNPPQIILMYPVSVLYREPKLLKGEVRYLSLCLYGFQCSTVSRNC